MNERRADQSRSDDVRADQARWEELAPVIDAALAELAERDRRSILLRYFCGKGVPEVAAALNVSHEAAKKRLTRGLEKLRKRLASRGVVVTTTLLMTALMAMTTPGFSQNWPDRPIQLVTGSNPGGPADVLPRIVTNAMR